SYDTFARDAAAIAEHFRPKLIFADEAQRLVNRKTKATKRLLEYVDIVQPKHCIPMSGSPIANRPDDLWPLLRLINPAMAGAATSFEKRYLKSKPVKWVRDEATGKMKPWTKTFGTGDKAREFTPMKLESLSPNKPAEAAILSELRMKIAPYVIRRLKKDVLKSLPGKIHERLDVHLGTKERKAYEELQARFAEAMAGVSEEGAETEETFFSWFIKAQQICSSLEILALGDESSKIEELKNFVEDNAADEKILIFSRFHAMTEIVCRELKEYKPLHLHGGVPQGKRQALVNDFQEKPEHRLFVSTLASGGVGLTLTAASIVARLDRWVAPTLNEQAEDRADRIGQKNVVTVVDFVVEDSVEERILEMLAKKNRMIASLISVDADGEQQERKMIRSLFRKKDMLNLI
ncbi:MAG: DEAD/DEAH box helicase, partial [Thaumarchaeota archaeon]|nr:DEAD/DEAH box helicase [Nitrososphaerota archaeon]